MPSENLLAVGAGPNDSPGNLETELYDVDSMEWSSLGNYPFETGSYLSTALSTAYLQLTCFL